MTTTTEIATVPLLPGTSLSDSDHTMLKETFALLHTVAGFQRFRFGIPLESPEDLQILIGKKRKEKAVTIPCQNFHPRPDAARKGSMGTENHNFSRIDWDSREHHEAFAASPAYKPWLQRLDKAVDTSKAKFHHVDFEPRSSLGKAVSAHVTEFTTFFFCDGSPAEKWLHEVDQVVRSIGGEDSLTSASGFMGVAYGITHEEVSRDGVNGKSGVVVMGWESEAARKAFREMQVFEGWLKLKGEAEAVEAIQVAFGQSAV
jgi:heme-degrading monooxygenase HmoA